MCNCEQCEHFVNYVCYLPEKDENGYLKYKEGKRPACLLKKIFLDIPFINNDVKLDLISGCDKYDKDECLSG